MVAALGFLDAVQIFVQVRLLDEARAVDALHLRIAFFALPVGAGDAHQLERLNLAGAGNVRAAAEIDELAGGVERDHRLGGFFLHQLAFENLIRFPVQLERLGLGQHLAFVGNVARSDIVHALFDALEILRQ